MIMEKTIERHVEQGPSADGEQGDIMPTPDDDRWLKMARDAYTQSTDWFDVSLRPTTEKAMAHFGNRHPPGSKYHSDSYKFRSKSFRPKTRATIRRNEAAAAVAFFSTEDMVNVTAENSDDKNQVMSAIILSELLNYRLDDDIPWFQTVIGAYQDTLNVGVCISHQDWDYEEQAKVYPIMDHMGSPMLDSIGDQMTQTLVQTLMDKPRVKLVAIENFRISPASDWTNPIATTPYIVELIPMFIGDVREKMVAGEWVDYDNGTIQAAAQTQYDSVRAARDGTKRADPQDMNHATTDFDTVWVHRNIVRDAGEDWIFYTLGTNQRLTEPKRLTEAYRHLARGERPYVMGNCLIEAHKAYAAGLNELTFGLQEDANEVNNQRRDNVRLAMNKRYFARRGANIDYKSLTRNVPGSVTLVDDINSDIRWDSPADVTGSSYQEQDRVSLDYDELAGTFSPGSVQSNRKLGDTVGGMEMLSTDANVITEYQLRVFAETYVEPVLKQVVKMEQAYETDEKVLAIAGQKGKLLQKFGVDKVTDAMLAGMVTVRVNVGFGSTNPQKRIEKLTLGLGAIAQLLPQVMQGLDGAEVVTEVFGALGYKDGKRFFPKLGDEQQDPQIAQMQQMIQQLQQALQGKQMEVEGRVKVETIKQQGNVQVATIETQAQSDENAKDRELEQLLQQMQDQADANQLTSEQTIWLQRLKVLVANKAMELRTQKELSFGKVTPQVAATTFEPAGRAVPGTAFQA